eukprot:1451757-Pleurochrysis_carterae.AAC.3
MRTAPVLHRLAAWLEVEKTVTHLPLCVTLTPLESAGRRCERISSCANLGSVRFRDGRVHLGGGRRLRLRLRPQHVEKSEILVCARRVGARLARVNLAQLRKAHVAMPDEVRQTVTRSIPVFSIEYSSARARVLTTAQLSCIAVKGKVTDKYLCFTGQRRCWGCKA